MSWATARGAVHRGAQAGVAAAAQHLHQASTTVAPIEQGDLIDSAKVSQDDLEAAVSYDTPYAVKEHEYLRAQHDPGRQGKYLEEPLHAEAPQLAQLMADGVRRATGG